MLTLFASAAFTLVSTANVLTADWSPQAAARYLDQRQKEWFEWKTAASGKPLHDRLGLLWASSTRSSVLSDVARTSLLNEVFAKQQSDGGWTLESLGPWTVHPDAPIDGSLVHAGCCNGVRVARASRPRSLTPCARRAIARWPTLGTGRDARMFGVASWELKVES